MWSIKIKDARKKYKKRTQHNNNKIAAAAPAAVSIAQINEKQQKIVCVSVFTLFV